MPAGLFVVIVFSSRLLEILKILLAQHWIVHVCRHHAATLTEAVASTAATQKRFTSAARHVAPIRHWHVTTAAIRHGRVAATPHHMRLRQIVGWVVLHAHRPVMMVRIIVVLLFQRYSLKTFRCCFVCNQHCLRSINSLRARYIPSSSSSSEELDDDDDDDSDVVEESSPDSLLPVFAPEPFTRSVDISAVSLSTLSSELIELTLGDLGTADLVSFNTELSRFVSMAFWRRFSRFISVSCCAVTYLLESLFRKSLPVNGRLFRGTPPSAFSSSLTLPNSASSLS